jgi:hypothetical protein
MLVVGGCSSNNGVAEAQAACKVGTPVLSNTTASANQTYGQVAKAYQAAQKHSAQAAAADSRWNNLNEAYGTLIAAWEALVRAGGPNTTNATVQPDNLAAVEASNAQWTSQADAAQATVRSECAVAKAS